MILITGGAGYIGSHCAFQFAQDGIDDILIFDNLSTGHIETIEALQKKYSKIKFVQGDLTKKKEVDDVFEKNDIDFVIHFASYSDVKESCENPQKYFENNVLSAYNLLNVMIKHKVMKIVFSSSAAVYGQAHSLPIDENHQLKPLNPYGASKLMIEKMLDDYDKSYNLKAIKLRYFNVIGAEKEAYIGEWHDNENHILPNILNSIKNNFSFKVYGNNYKTKDGTAIRDYIDVLDVIEAHKLAYLYLKKENKSDVFNLGNVGCSVLEMINAVEKELNKKVKIEFCNAREGDCPILLADSSRAKNILNWQPKRTLEDSIKTAYLWHNRC